MGLPRGGRSEFAKGLNVSPSYLYQLENGIRPISPALSLAIGERTGWKVTPHELLPMVYPHPDDGLPAHLRSVAPLRSA